MPADLIERLAIAYLHWRAPDLNPEPVPEQLAIEFALSPAERAEAAALAAELEHWFD